MDAVDEGVENQIEEAIRIFTENAQDLMSLNLTGREIAGRDSGSVLFLAVGELVHQLLHLMHDVAVAQGEVVGADEAGFTARRYERRLDAIAELYCQVVGQPFIAASIAVAMQFEGPTGMDA